MKTRVVLIGIGGATCSGKTTLAKHLRRILPDSVIIHQDDFAPPQELVPVHPMYGVQDWDRAEGAIEWPRIIKALEEVRRTGVIPPEHVSHDHLNAQKDVPIDETTFQKWRKRFEEVEQEHRERGEEVKWVIVDGFLLFWEPQVVEKLDHRIFLRVPHDVLKQRRHERHGYHTAEGSLWRDPPNYWEQIVWPAYVAAHEQILENGDVEHGKPNGKVPGLLLFEGLEVGMSEMVERVCSVLDTGAVGGD
ncbi:P-loop containing nucleoside triphosphate hydrolase protein [Dichomitus squalens LYAD-421 SS1]|uniref:P-loop containing nucleoside triphosphate hydrolase protein n=1 Tax=Dichomitus squalens (strain LYAD-421) TaxID=732165 RepID=R7SRN4_DICSQ|nr:P-loop containing nucleoside triphosphate hydrolase protein [Dichomitus squalens LYAD-421 SS1]EJF57622.1 P-loop containing nucleoside triphosphate hydrolase protein [Dichomitus squalens LYAD-421 SS1]